MRIWTVAARAAGKGEPDLVLVKEGFSWTAFLFGPFWFLWHRLWLGLLGFLAASVILLTLASLLGANELQAALVNLSFSLLVGWHAGDIRRWTLLRRGYRLVELVAARNEEEAEFRSLQKLATRTLALAP